MSILRNIPPFDGNVAKWATDVVNYLKSMETFIVTPSPKIVQLESRKNGAKATTDGLVMWDVTANTMVVSRGGAWYPVTLGALPLVSGGVEDGL